MNLNKGQFLVLHTLLRFGKISQRKLSAHTGMSLGKINRLFSELTTLGYISNGRITSEGLEVLQPYKVDNAIIMAAGMSSRFAPLSYEKPKGLLVVKGEVLIERQIKQLQEVGIRDITVVVGYMKERFFYLQEKFGVKIVINDDYWRYNNPSTLLRVLDQLKNTYICSSDNYFSVNVFEPFVYQSYYSAVFFPGACNEWGLKYSKAGRITGVDHEPTDMWCMLGHVFFSRSFSQKFSQLLLNEFDKGDTKFQLWEKLFERNTDQLEMYVRKYGSDEIFEFDSLEELRDFDPHYLENTGSKIFKNICSVLHCSEAQITDIQILKKGLTNLSFIFTCNEKQYIYRHPGSGTEKYISRKSEAFSMKTASDLKLDTTYIHLDAQEGWKLSHYIPQARELDYHNWGEVQKALGLLKRLHSAAIVSPYDFGIWERTKALLEKVSEKRKDFSDFEELFSKMQQLNTLAAGDNVPKILCHCDSYDPNFLIDANGEMVLIDWEYSGNDDPANDLGTFICCSDYNYEEALHVLELYYERPLTHNELRHCLAYIAISSFYWFVWALYQESIGNIIGQYIYLWYQNTKTYLNRALPQYYNEEEK